MNETQGAPEQQSSQGFHASSEVDDVGGAILESVERALSFQSTTRVEDSLDGYTDSERAELFESAAADDEVIILADVIKGVYGGLRWEYPAAQGMILLVFSNTSFHVHPHGPEGRCDRHPCLMCVA